MSTHAMVDIETLGTKPNSVVLTVGGCKFNPFTMDEPFDFFLMKLDVDQQKANVKLVGFADYPSLGPSHSELDAKRIMKLFKNIKSFFPKNSDETRSAVLKCYKTKGPTFISLKADKKIGKKW